MDYKEQALEILKNKKAMVICGGGVLGIAECGAIIQLEEMGLNLKNLNFVCGSSVGSIIATSIACKGTTDYMRDMMNSLDFSRFHDNDCLIRTLCQLIKKFGMNETKEIRKLISKVLTDLVGNPDITFRELYDKTKIHLSITYMLTNIEGENCTIYADYMSEPDSLVRETVVKSSSIPLFYEAHMDGKGKNKLVSCDGGVLDNYPINIPRGLGYDPNEIIGLKLIAGKEVHHTDNGGPGMPLKIGPAPANVIKYLMNIVNKLRNQALRLHVSKYDWMLSVKIGVGILSSTDFDLSDEQSDWLFDQGKKGALKYVTDLAKLLEKGKYPYGNEEIL
jgi:NTE family protein